MRPKVEVEVEVEVVVELSRRKCWIRGDVPQ
jgi:hypothetical protein